MRTPQLQRRLPLPAGSQGLPQARRDPGGSQSAPSRELRERAGPSAPPPAAARAACSPPSPPREGEVSRARARGAARALVGGSRRDGPGRASLPPPAALREPQAAAASSSFSAGIPAAARPCPQRAARRTPARASAERRFLAAGIMSAGQPPPPQPDESPAPPLPPGANTGEAAGTGPPCAAGLAGGDIKMEVSGLGLAGPPRCPRRQVGHPGPRGAAGDNGGAAAGPHLAKLSRAPARRPLFCSPSLSPSLPSSRREPSPAGWGCLGGSHPSAPSDRRGGVPGVALFLPPGYGEGRRRFGRVTPLVCFLNGAAGAPRAPTGFHSAPASPETLPSLCASCSSCEPARRLKSTNDVYQLKCFKTFFVFFFSFYFFFSLREEAENGVRVVGGVVLATGAYIPEISRVWK